MTWKRPDSILQRCSRLLPDIDRLSEPSVACCLPGQLSKQARANGRRTGMEQRFYYKRSCGLFASHYCSYLAECD